MALPTKKPYDKITFAFGVKYTVKKGRHKGADFACPVGTPIFATTPGVVVHAGSNGVGPTRGWGKAFGISVIVNQDKFPDGSAGLYGGYMHLSKVVVKRGQRVAKGELIGYSGNTGFSTGPHLHYEIQKARFWAGWVGCRNPRKWLAA